MLEKGATTPAGDGRPKPSCSWRPMPRAAGWIGAMLTATWPRRAARRPRRAPLRGCSGTAEHPDAWVVLDLASFYAERHRADHTGSHARSPGPDHRRGRARQRGRGPGRDPGRRAGLPGQARAPPRPASALPCCTPPSASEPRPSSPTRRSTTRSPACPTGRCSTTGWGWRSSGAGARGASVAVLFLDVDNFKQVNDSLGHAAGDQVLDGLADRLRTMLRPMDTDLAATAVTSSHCCSRTSGPNARWC